MKNEYYLKKLYFNAGKTLMSRNMELAVSCVNSDKINYIYEKYICNQYFKNIYFYDITGAVGDVLIKKAKNNPDCNSVFIFQNDSLYNGLNGYYNYNKNLFIYIFNENISLCPSPVDINYYNLYTGYINEFQRLKTIAVYYFEKAKSLD